MPCERSHGLLQPQVLGELVEVVILRRDLGTAAACALAAARRLADVGLDRLDHLAARFDRRPARPRESGRRSALPARRRSPSAPANRAPARRCSCPASVAWPAPWRSCARGRARSAAVVFGDGVASGALAAVAEPLVETVGLASLGGRLRAVSARAASRRACPTASPLRPTICERAGQEARRGRRAAESCRWRSWECCRP